LLSGVVGGLMVLWYWVQVNSGSSLLLASDPYQAAGVIWYFAAVAAIFAVSQWWGQRSDRNAATQPGRGLGVSAELAALTGGIWLSHNLFLNSLRGILQGIGLRATLPWEATVAILFSGRSSSREPLSHSSCARASAGSSEARFDPNNEPSSTAGGRTQLSRRDVGPNPRVRNQKHARRISSVRRYKEMLTEDLRDLHYYGTARNDGITPPPHLVGIVLTQDPSNRWHEVAGALFDPAE
jgi:hypothetical protein